VKVLVTGAGGMLGRDLCRVFGERHDVIATDVEEMDVRDHALVLATVERSRPEIVVHLAGITDVDQCERDPDLAYGVNALGTKNVALACQRANVTMVYVSTLAVFDGTKCEPYTEFDKPNPQSQYARSKYQGELVVRDFLDEYYVVRAGWLFGGGQRDKKFVGVIIERARARSELKVVNDKFGSPSYTKDLSSGILQLVETRQYGTYHMVNTGSASSRYEIARKILEYARIDTCRLIACSSADFPLAAPRPRMEAGQNFNLGLMGLGLMRPWQAALREYIETTWNEQQDED
jgi:dTDP-4-dehydrorhamnose reductase